MKTKIGYLYYDKWYVIDISANEYILSLIHSGIDTDERLGITHPNDVVDDIIKKFVDEELKNSENYRKGHAEKILIYEDLGTTDSKLRKLHEINGYFSDEEIQKIIRKIKEGE